MDKDRHSIILENRKILVVDGVVDVISFDETFVELDTFGGRLNVSGNEIRIHELCLEKSRIEVEGKICELVYEDVNTKTKKGIFGRLMGQ